MTANQLYKETGTNVPFSEWLGQMKSQHGEDFIQKYSMGNIDAETSPQPVVLGVDGVTENGSINKDNNYLLSFLVIGGLVFLGFCYYKGNNK